MIQQQAVAAILVAAAVCELSYFAVLLRCELWEGVVNFFVIGRLHGASGGSWVMLVQPPLKTKRHHVQRSVIHGAKVMIKFN